MSGLTHHPRQRVPRFDLIHAESTSNGSWSVPASPAFNAGDLALAFGFAEDNTSTPPSDTTPTGWTKLATTTAVDGSQAARATTYWKELDGTENSTTISDFVNQDADKTLIIVLRPVSAQVVTVSSVGIAMDHEEAGTAPATSSVSLSGVTEKFIVGLAVCFCGEGTAGSLDLTADGGFACTPGVGEGDLYEENDTDPSQIIFWSAALWKNGDEPASVSAAVGDAADEWNSTFAAAVEIEI